VKIALVANNGKYVSAELGGGIDSRDTLAGRPLVALRANRDEAKSWETFEVVPLGDGYVGLKTADGFFVTAEDGGGSTVSTSRTEANDWERWKMVDGGFQCVDGVHFLSAEILSPDPVLVANRTHKDAWETFGLTVVVADAAAALPGTGTITPPGPTVRRTGHVVAQGRQFADAGGAFNPLLASLFWVFWGWKFDRDRTKANLLALSGFDGIRAFCEVGGGTWEDRTVDPNWPDFEQVLADAIDYCYDVVGYRVQLTIIAGGTGHDPVDVARKVRNVIAPREHKIIYSEAANEAFNNLRDGAQLKATGMIIREAFPAMLCAASSPEGGDIGQATAYTDSGQANMTTHHFDRSNNFVDGPARQIRQSWDARDLRKPASQSEPAGPESSVATQEQPIHLALQRAVGVLAGLAAYCFHSGPGVRGGGQADRDRGRHANFWELPGFQLMVDALKAVGYLLPDDLVNWQKFNGHWEGHPLPADTVWTDGFDHGCSRTYGAVQGDRFLTIPFGIREYVRLWALRTCTVEVFNPTTGALLETHQLKGGAIHTNTESDGRRWFSGDGDSFVLNGPERGGLFGYIVKGRFN
jgi:hypothetical protein